MKLFSEHRLSITLGALFLGAIIILLTACGAENIKPLPDARTQFDRAMDLYNRGKYISSETEFQRFIYNYPGNTAVDTAQFYLGMSYYNDKDYALAAGEFKKFLTSFPSSDFADDSQYRLAMCHYFESPNYSLDQSDTDIAIEEFQTFLDNYPYSDFADSAKIHLAEMNDKLAFKAFSTARLYQKMSYFDPAILYYDQVLRDYPESPYAAEALYRKGECYMKLEKYLLARDSFLRYIDEHKGDKFYNDATSKLRELEDMPKAER